MESEAEQHLEIPSSLDRVRPLGEQAPGRCPRCFESLQLAEVDEQPVLLCEACNGLLIQSHVLASVIKKRRQDYKGPDEKPTPLDASQLKKRVNCPGCSQPMEVHPYHGPGNSIIDSCARCGFTFLDYGELSAIEKAPGVRE